MTIRTHIRFAVPVLVCTWTPVNPTIRENNSVNAVVTTITTTPGVTLQLTEPINSNFSLKGNDVIANIVLDHEVGHGLKTASQHHNIPKPLSCCLI